LHTVGGLSYLNRESYGIPWQTLFSLPGNDLCDMHLYSDGDLNITLPMLAGWCGDRGMPLLVEEFGAKTGVRGRGIGFWNLGPELGPPGSYEVSLLTPLTFAAIRQSAPVAPAEQLVYFNDFNSPPGSEFPEWSSPGHTY
jgi:hypothetical protein